MNKYGAYYRLLLYRLLSFRYVLEDQSCTTETTIELFLYTDREVIYLT